MIRANLYPPVTRRVYHRPHWRCGCRLMIESCVSDTDVLTDYKLRRILPLRVQTRACISDIVDAFEHVFWDADFIRGSRSDTIPCNASSTRRLYRFIFAKGHVVLAGVSLREVTECKWKFRLPHLTRIIHRHVLLRWFFFLRFFTDKSNGISGGWEEHVGNICFQLLNSQFGICIIL